MLSQRSDDVNGNKMEKKYYMVPTNGIGWTNAPAHIMPDGMNEYTITVYEGSQSHYCSIFRYFTKNDITKLPEVFQTKLKELFKEFLKGSDTNDLTLSQHGSKKFATEQEISSIREALNDIWGV